MTPRSGLPSVSRRIIGVQGLLFLVLTLVNAFVVYWGLYEYFNRQLQHEAEEQVVFLAESIASPIWTLGGDEVERICRQLLHTPYIHRIRITDNNARPLYDFGGPTVMPGEIVRNAPIFFDELFIGTIEIRFNKIPHKRRARQALFIILGTQIIVCLPVLMLSGFLFRRSLSPPLDRMRQRLHRIAEARDPESPLPWQRIEDPLPDDPPEFEEFIGLHEQFSRMARTVQEREKSLRRANERLETEHADRLEMEKALRQARKMEAVGTMAGGIAHDFNNVLAIIMSSAELMELKLSRDERMTPYIRNILNSAERARDLIERILMFSRHAEPRKQPVRPASILREAVSLLEPLLPMGVHIHQDIQTNLFLKADPTQLHQVIMNLCLNAGNAMEGKGGDLHLHLSEVEIDSAGKHKEKTAAGRTGDSIRNPFGDMVPEDLAPGQWLLFMISDTGCGIDEAHLERIFDPFFTTRGKEGGTGMGLSMVHGIIAGHNGVIQVDSRLGRGTCFAIWLPVSLSSHAATRRDHDHMKPEQGAKTSSGPIHASVPALDHNSAPGHDSARESGDPMGNPPDELAADRPVPSLPGGGERILFVDDEPELADTGKEMFHRLGYQVHSFTSSPEALARFRQAPHAVDLLITDMTMPRMGGDELIASVRAIRPDIPVIICTGYSKKLEDPRIEEMGIQGLLMKPFEQARAARMIRSVLDRKEDKAELNRFSL